MKCPVCSHATKVLRTLKLDNPNKAIRNRVCVYCGYYFCTQEIIDHESKELPSLPQPTEDK
ncbi:hypothetical protein MASR2M64_15180 [Candidatus Cloacimonadota bacterium]